MSERIKKNLPPKSGPLKKLRESIDDPDEQFEAVATLVRIVILIWSGAILTLAYIKMPPALGIPEQKLDPTFIASVFTGTLADRKSTRLNSSHVRTSRMPSSA